MTSGTTGFFVRKPAATAASKIARACISAISGNAIAIRQPRKPSIGLNSESSCARCLSFSTLTSGRGCDLRDFGFGVRQEFVQRRVEQLDRDRQSLHDLEQPDEVLALHRKKFRERRAAALLIISENHFAHGENPVFIEKHVLGAAEADAFGAK